jgi:twinkle protein
MTFLASDAEESAPSLDWILERARDCVMRLGITDLVIDPFNELEQSHSKEMNETQFIGASLQRCNAFKLRHGCNVWILAHPAKPPPPMKGQPVPVPNGYSINGSSHRNHSASAQRQNRNPPLESQVSQARKEGCDGYHRI